MQSLHAQQCGSCLARPPRIHRCIPTFRYAPPLSKLINAYKHRASFAAGLNLASIMLKSLETELSNYELPQLLLPVPLHRNRLRERGFNQAWELSKFISLRLGIPADNSILRKTRHTAPQSALSKNRRRSNLRGAFAYREERKFQYVNHIALIDDVVTTMNTVNEISRVLGSHGISRIEVWCLARAGR